MIYYKIAPKCSPGMVLTLNLGASAAKLEEDSTQDLDRKLWAPVEIVSGDDKGFALLNKHSQKILAAPTDNSGLTEIGTEPDGILKNRAIWKFKGLGYGAIQLQADPDMNLNVFGNGPYKSGSEVGVWDWARGADNEVWEMKLVGDL